MARALLRDSCRQPAWQGLAYPADGSPRTTETNVAENTMAEANSGTDGADAPTNGASTNGASKGMNLKGMNLKDLNKAELMRKGRVFVHRVLDFGQRKYHRALGHAAAAVPEGPVGGLCGLTARFPFTSEQILLGYAQGMFPMDKRGSIQWTCPDPRCVVLLDKFHVPSRIKTYLRKGLFDLCFDKDPAAVLTACGDRTETWLTPRVQSAYRELFDLGAMHTVEAWKGDRLVGGAFGVALGTVFTVESMFSHEDHASKLAFAFLGQHLIDRGFSMIDCQYQQDHFARFGAVEMSREEYRKRIALGMIHPPSFHPAKSA